MVLDTSYAIFRPMASASSQPTATGFKTAPCKTPWCVINCVNHIHYLLVLLVKQQMPGGLGEGVRGLGSGRGGERLKGVSSCADCSGRRMKRCLTIMLRRGRIR